MVVFFCTTIVEKFCVYGSSACFRPEGSHKAYPKGPKDGLGS